MSAADFCVSAIGTSMSSLEFCAFVGTMYGQGTLRQSSSRSRCFCPLSMTPAAVDAICITRTATHASSNEVQIGGHQLRRPGLLACSRALISALGDRR